MRRKTLIPNDFKDFLSVLSFIGFISIFLAFTFGVTWIEENMTGLFLLLGGAAFLVVSKVFTLRKWVRDGIQSNEFTYLLGIVFGLSSMIIGILFIFGTTIPIKFYGYVGIIALIPAIYTLIDYIVKNRR